MRSTDYCAYPISSLTFISFLLFFLATIYLFGMALVVVRRQASMQYTQYTYRTRAAFESNLFTFNAHKIESMANILQFLFVYTDALASYVPHWFLTKNKELWRVDPHLFFFILFFSILFTIIIRFHAYFLNACQKKVNQILYWLKSLDFLDQMRRYFMTYIRKHQSIVSVRANKVYFL